MLLVFRSLFSAVNTTTSIYWAVVEAENSRNENITSLPNLKCKMVYFWMKWPFKVTPFTVNGHISQLAWLSFQLSQCERGDLHDVDVSLGREPLRRELLSRLWEHCFWVWHEERVYASCQKFVNSLPELHRHLQCHSRCHVLLGEVVISNFNFAMWSKPCAGMCVRAQMCALACVEINLCRLVCVSAS